jgi:cobalt-zinc-cadmium efflux system outer membrane protein
VGLTATLATAQEPLDVDAYARIVQRAHPGGREVAALEEAARAEQKAARQLPDPTVSFAWDRARAPDGEGLEFSERSLSVTQTLPWPGRYSANKRAGDRAAEVLRAEATSAGWELEIEARATFARLLYARAALEIARAAEEDALALRDLTARRAELGESREADRIKAQVEWLRQQRTRRAAERETEAVEAVFRILAVEPLPRPLLLAGGLPAGRVDVDPATLRAGLEQSNPRLLAARAALARDLALASAARRGRLPDLDLSYFHDDEVDKEANGLSVGVRIPLWSANRGEIARAEATADLAASRGERTLLELSAALERACQALDVASGQAAILEQEILPAAMRSLELARFSYHEGETSLLDLLDAQRTFRETQRESYASRLDVALALSDVQRLVGPAFSLGR